MSEADFGRYFVDFLTTEKGYPKGSILLEAPLADNKGNSRRYIADLILLDTNFNNYLALIEFKGRIKHATKDALIQVKTYLEVLDRPNLPAYLVIPKEGGNNEINFKIFFLDDNDWREIEREDFPHYETLSSKYLADEKKEIKDLNNVNKKEVRKKRELIRDTAFSTLASLIAAVSISFVLSEQILFKDKDAVNPIGIGIGCCDSVHYQHEKISNKIMLLEKSLLDIKKQDSIVRVDAVKIKLSQFNNRLNKVEAIIDQSPERLIKIQELTYQIQSLKLIIETEKELNDTKITNLKERLDQLTIWTSGLIITIIGSIIGFAVNAFRKS